MAIDASIYPSYAAECGDPSRTKILGFGRKPALVLVDVCAAFTSPDSPLCLARSDIERSTDAISRLLSAVRSNEGDGGFSSPTFFTQTVYTHPTLRDAGLAAKKNPHASAFAAAHPLNLTAIPIGVFPALEPGTTDTIIKKKYPSPFFGTNLATQLAALGIDTVVLGGFLTSSAVRSAAIDAMQSGFRPIVVADACADRGHETHWANLMDHNAKYGDVVGLEEACIALRRAGVQTQ